MATTATRSSDSRSEQPSGDENSDYDYGSEYSSDDDLDSAAFEGLLEGLEEGAGPDAHLGSLSKICESLSLVEDVSFSWRTVNAAIPPIVRLAGSHVSAPDVVLLSARALAYMCDAMPWSVDVVVSYGAVPVLCQRLLKAEDADLGEQCLQALNMISREQAVSCLQAGTIAAVLSHIDFFDGSVQRVAISSVANLCKKIPKDCASIVMESLPVLCNLLQCHDQKIVETVSTCLIRITECFGHSSELLDEFCTYGVIQNSLDVIQMDAQMSLSVSTYTNFLRLFTKLSSRSLLAFETLFKLNISNYLRGILVVSIPSSGTPSTLEDAQAYQLLQEVLKLLNQLIPPLATYSDEDVQLTLKKEKILKDKPEYLHQLSVDTLPLLLQVVNYCANLCICYGCVSIINDIVYFLNHSMLLNLLKGTNIASFLAGLLARKDRHVLALTLKIVKSLMQKLPDAFSKPFIKEGVVCAIDALLTLENCSLSMLQNPTNLEHSDLDSGVASENGSSCLCYAFDPSSSSKKEACRLGKDVVFTSAKRIKAAYFTNELMSTVISRKLKKLCKALNEIVDKFSVNYGFPQNEENSTNVLDQLMNLFLEEDLSTFEFTDSGMAKSLAYYLSNGMYLQGSENDFKEPDKFLAAVKRCQTFAGICLSKMGPGQEEVLLSLLVRKVQDALSSTDNFPVILSLLTKPRSTYYDTLISRLTLHPYVAVRFLNEEGEANLCEHDDVLEVDLSSSFDDIEGILWPEISKIHNGRNISSTSEAASVSKHAEERDSQDITNTLLEPSISSSLEGLVLDEGEPLPVEISAETRELIPVSSSVEGQVNAVSKLTFYLNGKELDRSATLFEALIQDKRNAPDTILDRKFWMKVHEIKYKTKGGPKKIDYEEPKDSSQLSLLSDEIGFSWKRLPVFPGKLDKLNPSYDILYLLKVLEGLNRISMDLMSYEWITAFAEEKINKFVDLKMVVPSVPKSEFINRKLTDKLEEQLRDPLSVSINSIPPWCSQLMVSSPFLFSFEARWKFFQLSSIGFSAFQTNQLKHNNACEIFQVNRHNILESAALVMDTLASRKVVTEVVYDEEAGTGLGPTVEFYTLVSREFQKVGLGMWREDHCPFIESGISEEVGSQGFVVSGCGLFPRPWSAATSVLNGITFSQVMEKFSLLGKIAAKAIKDGRILDIPFSRAFYKLILDQDLGIYDIQSFDPMFGRTLLEFKALTMRKRYLESISGENLMDSSRVCYRNMRVEDLCLDFTLPGYMDYELTYRSKSVNLMNLEDYISLVVCATIKSGISRQVEAFKSGFNKVLPLKALQAFTEDELERLLCGEQDTWNIVDLQDHIEFDHGYTPTSLPAVHYLEIIQEFGRDDRRSFLQFVTGAPRLPLGGLAALKPKLKIVQKHCSSDIEMDLPSVMTCANYLKLPPYSTKETMRQKLLYAITEGQGAFQLS